MILLFHWFTSFLYSLFRKRMKQRAPSSWSNFTITKLNSPNHPLAQRDAENDIKFDPPVYKQRYERAVDILLDEKWKNQVNKVVDFGCAEFGFFVFLKNRLSLSELLLIDIDDLLLNDYLYRVYPLNADHLVGRPKPLTVNVYAGSIAEPDPSLLNTDAVIALEIIEHLYPDTLDALPYNIFSYIRPKLVIVTTPNAEFNVLFTKLQKFRHADHKFEWTREQFQSWATNITSRFPSYTVQFDGVGLGPHGTDDSIGCCSQLAVFIRKDVICDTYEETCNVSNDSCGCNSYGVCTYHSHSRKLPDYKLIASINYPYDVDTRTEDEKILDELKYRMHLFENSEEEFYNVETKCFQIPLNQLIYHITKPFPPEPDIRKILLKYNYKIEECRNPITKKLESCVIYEAEMDSGGSGSDTEASGYGSDNKYNVDEGKFSDWDENDLTWTSSTSKENEPAVSSKGVKTQLHLEVNESKNPQALFDSGYQKSPPDDSPQSKDQAVALDFKSLNDRPNKLSHILSVFDNFDKINELDAVRREKKYFNFASNLPHREVMKKICQEIAKHPIAGPSRDPKKGKQLKKSQSSDSDESVDDVKSITTCILENSLNKIECQDEDIRGNLIQELIPEENLEEIPVVEPILIVENGDLANNNRDLEGNNYPAEDVEQNDEIVDNQELINANNNDVEVAVAQAEEDEEENIEIEPPVDVEVAWSSREALFDINSQVDLLEDFEMEASDVVVNGVSFPNSCVIVAENNDPVLPPEESGFPNWLLQIFDEAEVLPPEDDLHDEPHFYCQGDGLGMISWGSPIHCCHK
ncbi:uncharacterized protein Hen1 isoform X2 [Tribolium castaneum]|uniref:uncharacterized protein Hen1 isoform X2 n=1 Tax=Tribolium castaneum TaxID=7070 RepID=UPI00046BECAC|nr:PREDICTED: uncharacterized protein LOC656404 isoform X2 [Tribolium castaneum]|eukprot:XP_008200824.1 PREDICTED: uncharacterized protein LOC656404 isoform X2 [Tribolium castaneum]